MYSPPRTRKIIQVSGLDTAVIHDDEPRIRVYDKKQTGLVNAHHPFALRMMGLHGGRVSSHESRSNTAGDTTVEFIRELQGIDFAGEAFSRTFGVQPRLRIATSNRLFGIADVGTGILDDTMEELLDTQ